MHQLGYGHELVAVAHGYGALQVLHDKALGAQHEGVAVSRLLVGVFHTVNAAAAFYVEYVNLLADNVLEDFRHGADGAVSAATNAPRAYDVDFALEFPFGAGNAHHADEHEDCQKESCEFFHVEVPLSKYIIGLWPKIPQTS